MDWDQIMKFLYNILRYLGFILLFLERISQMMLKYDSQFSEMTAMCKDLFVCKMEKTHGTIKTGGKEISKETHHPSKS